MLNGVGTELYMVVVAMLCAAGGLDSSRVVENGKVEREVQAMHANTAQLIGFVQPNSK